MLHPTASALVMIGIAALAVTVAALAVVGVAKVRPSWAMRAAAAVVGWFILTFALAASGLLPRFDLKPPPMALLFVFVISGGLVLGLSRIGHALSELPLSTLVLFQSFRLPLELVMHEAAREGTMPNVMTFTGLNFDIVTGITALILGFLLTRGIPRWLAWVWSAIGFACLLAIAIVSFLASPMVVAFGPHEINTWVTHAPFVWLPAVLVVAALAGQIAVVRHLLGHSASPPPPS